MGQCASRPELAFEQSRPSILYYTNTANVYACSLQPLAARRVRACSWRRHNIIISNGRNRARRHGIDCVQRVQQAAVDGGHRHACAPAPGY